MKLAAIVTIYNQDKGLLHNVLSYIEYVDRLLIFDNNSNPINDETNFATLKDNPKVEYVSFNENKGISVALNYALSRYHDYDYILTMDQDSYFEKNEFKKYINYVSNCDSIMSSRTAIFAPSLSVSQDSPLIDFPWRVITSGNIVNVKIAQSIGGYDEKLFIDEVDHDFCFSIKENGYDIVRLNFVHMKHHLGAYKTYNIMGRKVHTTNHSEIRRYYMVRLGK